MLGRHINKYDLNGFSVFSPSEEEWKEERHQKALSLLRRQQALYEESLREHRSWKRELEKMRRATKEHKRRIASIKEETEDLGVILGDWGY